MEFSKAIQIKKWVNVFNEQREVCGYGRIKFEAEMFRIGKWSVSLRAEGSELFFSDEMARLFILYNEGGFSLRVFAINGCPIIDMQ